MARDDVRRAVTSRRRGGSDDVPSRCRASTGGAGHEPHMRETCYHHLTCFVQRLLDRQDRGRERERERERGVSSKDRTCVLYAPTWIWYVVVTETSPVIVPANEIV